MKISKAISIRTKELLKAQNMTQYQLFIRSGVPQSTISSIVRCLHDKPYITVIYDISQGLGVSLVEFFSSPLFDIQNIED